MKGPQWSEHSPHANLDPVFSEDIHATLQDHQLGLGVSIKTNQPQSSSTTTKQVIDMDDFCAEGLLNVNMDKDHASNGSMDGIDELENNKLEKNHHKEGGSQAGSEEGLKKKRRKVLWI